MYLISNTEKNQGPASDYETKSLLYLFGKIKDKKNINIAAIDTLNDVTGASGCCTALWDIQSKGVKNLTPGEIGAALYTLYKNYNSHFNNYFKKYILLTPEIKKEYFLSLDKDEHAIDSFTVNVQKKITDGLLKKLKKNNLPVDEKSINSFLNEVIFVRAVHDEEKYVKNVIPFKSNNKRDAGSYKEIFKEIRDRQSSLKNYPVEGKTISYPEDILKYRKHIKKIDIEMLIVNRLVGEEVFQQRLIPQGFIEELIGLNKDDREDVILECNSNISRAFFNKNSKKEFWDLFNQIVSNIKNCRNAREVLNLINVNVLSKITIMDELSILFLIALIQQGLENDN